MENGAVGRTDLPRGREPQEEAPIATVDFDSVLPIGSTYNVGQCTNCLEMKALV